MDLSEGRELPCPPPEAARAVRVLVVDDSAFIRTALTRMLSSERSVAVVGTASNGAEALRMLPLARPDVITLDLEMPVMDGLETLRAVMRDHPVPVLMLSAHTAPGAEATLKALELGAADFMLKPARLTDSEAAHLRAGLVARVLALACRHAGPRGIPPPRLPQRALQALPRDGFRLVVMGASTGGPRALQQILESLPRELGAGVLVVQHMPPLFTSQFAARLDALAQVPVREARESDTVEAGQVLLAPGDFHMEVTAVEPDRARVRLSREPASELRPSVDVLFRSAARRNGPRTLAVVLTGMGSDGRAGMTEIHRTGGVTLAQDADSCVVYGMPRACVEAGVVDRVVSLEEVGGAILEVLGAARPARARKAS
ncbi:MAG TPA: chemotaxis response regulator protein-glutamate methylesterase [Candidatus Saccharimonadales bacterium]|nr:chemotaxis response regulator protein-glutamate methylesterase [Candidatus Saccharimonadales bacterium]